MNGRATLAIRSVLIIGIPVLVVLGTYLFMSRNFMRPLNSEDKREVIVEITPGLSFKQICQKIEDSGVIRSGKSLSVLARIRQISDNRISAGEYILSPSMTPKEVLQALVDGKVLKRTVVIKEGLSIWTVGELVEKAGLMGRSDFESAVTDPSLLVTAGIGAHSFEGYLFPETYNFSRPITAKQIIWRMLEEGEKHWPKEFTEQSDKLGLSRHETLVLASIIEKESGNIDEQPLISSVFHNRLSQGMKLQSDPTVIYGIKNFNGNLTRQDLETPSAYNTYLNFGLPPTPICNPGGSAIRAALFPAESTFIFFVADGTGRHVFSTTLAEHNEAVKKFQLQRQPAPDLVPKPIVQPKPVATQSALPPNS